MRAGVRHTGLCVCPPGWLHWWQPHIRGCCGDGQTELVLKWDGQLCLALVNSEPNYLYMDPLHLFGARRHVSVYVSADIACSVWIMINETMRRAVIIDNQTHHGNGWLRSLKGKFMDATAHYTFGQ